MPSYKFLTNFSKFDQDAWPALSTNVLVVVLQRWTYKIDATTDEYRQFYGNIKVEQFDPDNIVFPQLANDNQVSWRLSAAICHEGLSTHAGHYWAWRRCSNGMFMKMNDAKKPEVKTMEKFSSFDNMYMMVLERNL